MFRCDTGKCISKWARCDNYLDCPGGEDEVVGNCRECKLHEFKCNNSYCIPMRWKCDGEVDCSDGSDEIKCESKH